MLDDLDALIYRSRGLESFGPALSWVRQQAIEIAEGNLDLDYLPADLWVRDSEKRMRRRIPTRELAVQVVQVLSRDIAVSRDAGESVARVAATLLGNLHHALVAVIFEDYEDLTPHSG